jgi:YHS domain-containing protein
MNVESSSTIRAEHEGTVYLFCSEGCRDKFKAAPESYLPAGDEPDAAGRDQGVKSRQKGRGRQLKDYLPLIIIVIVTALAAAAKQAAYAQGWSGMSWMHDFMGFFLVVFAMFKLFNLEGFADGFQMYDLLAKSFRPYAFVYPFIELGLGLGYLAHWQPGLVYGTTIVVMIFGSLGVFRALAKGLDLDCACMGTFLRVPLSTVALVEDLGMAAMAAGMLFLR